MDQARRLLDGKFHEDEEEDDMVEIKPKSNLNGPILARDEDDLER